ncbi:small nuclear ribonucleoprotein F (nucleomorph) [Chroomonas mesostigmatica CCMP1168]|uniref:Sm protein F n=1 Tax=Chroomonas mesostigmatica CCMP1168 TaxID=1195612 RepID=J7GAP7_9CRYP|nr:small nuclear ribonucleoprotein F [Chroomonas mesostigmatica CCMP1168]AFP65368.1 small nuclear ribonucleoprotein F [Chroomonas mesostigmatica CCMP1168]AFP65379.1 small nuclear ribonucleoprotein F [Chroomonas mesostigmatica CCMP1168]AFP65540.1 small nuclear ribonucleoprotein F [Chroomonas mesostigmatica CCMP1168]AFP65551.1 small nuclear ribonucleoprotein F [Chroomonas mesostigmatica CCMP1168]
MEMQKKEGNTNPKFFLKTRQDKMILVKLKWGMEYRGILQSFDAYMNIRMKNAEEWIYNEKAGFLEEVLIRCNNILYIANHMVSHPPFSPSFSSPDECVR